MTSCTKYSGVLTEKQDNSLRRSKHSSEISFRRFQRSYYVQIGGDHLCPWPLALQSPTWSHLLLL